MEDRSNKQFGRKPAFTIVELLTVMAVIAILIGLLVPALNLVRRHAKDTQQRAQFNAISAALELFRSDNGEYPRSDTLPDPLGGGPFTTGAQHLAEALLGRDLQGFDPASSWDAQDDFTNVGIRLAYTTDTAGAPASPQKASLDRRKGPYLDLEKVGAFNIDKLYPLSSAASQIYGTTPAAIPAPGAAMTGAPFITDSYVDRQVTVFLSATVTRTIRAGTPVLYYRADESKRDLRKVTGDLVGGDFSDRTYNYNDNSKLLALGKMMSETAALPATTDARFHPMADPGAGNVYTNFYDKITNPQIAIDEGIAVRKDTYILMSAGRDGLFGTSDDIYNFGD